VNGFWQDVRYAYRMLIKNPGFTAVVVIAMGLGIGANTMIFSVLNAILLRDLPIEHSERLVAIEARTPREGAGAEFSFPDLSDLRQRSRTLESVSGFYTGLALVTLGRDAERLQDAVISPGLFHTLGLRPMMGREFLPEEEQEGKQYASVIISHRIWSQRLGSDPKAVGRTLKINGRVRTVVGVMPPGIRFPETADFWLPLAYLPADMARHERFLDVIGRLRPGATVDQARAELGTLARSLLHDHPESNRGVTFLAEPYREYLAKEIRPPMIMLMSAVVFVLLIACANVANLMLARATVRQREMGLRAALGAGRGRLARQLLTESVMVALAGGALGVLIAYWSNDIVMASIPIELAWWMKFGIDGGALLFTAAVAVASGLLFGLAPVFQVTDQSLYESLKDGGSQVSAGRAHHRMRNGLVVTEIALSLVLLAGAGLMIRSFLRMQEIRGGLDPQGVITGRVTLPVAVYPEDGDRRRFFAELLPEIASLPGVVSASVTGQLPYGNSSSTRPIMVEGHEQDREEQMPWANYSPVSPGFFATLRIPRRLGRDFVAEDRAGSPPVAIVNESAARLLWPGQDPLGRRLRFGARDTSAWRTVIGVVADVRQLARRDRVSAQVYVAHAQDPVQSMTLVVRARGNPAALTDPLRRLVRARDADLPLYDLRTMPEAVYLAVWEPRLYALLMAFFALIALVIAAVGIYGVMAYSVAHRTQEIGIRMAMGAAQGTVVRMVVVQGMRLTALGLGIGLAVAFVITRLMASLLFGVSAGDPPTFLGVAVILAGSALLACWLPARRATRIDPMVALRSE